MDSEWVWVGDTIIREWGDDQSRHRYVRRFDNVEDSRDIRSTHSETCIALTPIVSTIDHIYIVALFEPSVCASSHPFEYLSPSPSYLLIVFNWGDLELTFDAWSHVSLDYRNCHSAWNRFLHCAGSIPFCSNFNFKHLLCTKYRSCVSTTDWFRPQVYIRYLILHSIDFYLKYECWLAYLEMNTRSNLFMSILLRAGRLSR